MREWGPKVFPARGILAVAVFACSGLAAQAQVLAVAPAQELKRLSIEELLQQKILSVSRRPEDLGRVPSSVFLIRGQAVSSSGATTLPELLRLAPQLFVAQTSAHEWAIGARGFTRANGQVNKMQVMIDGRTVYSPLFSGVFWESQQIFLPDLDRIEVISGPAGVTWGANAVNGVINITTKSAAATQGSLLYVGFGDELKANVGARYGGTLGSDAHYRVYARHIKHDASRAGDGIGPGLDRWDSTSAGFRADGGDENSAVSWTVQGDVFSGDFHDPGLGGLPFVTQEGANVRGRWTRRFTDDADLTLRLYHDYTARDQDGALRERLRTTDLELQHRLPLGLGHDFLWGAHYRHMNENVDNWDGVLAFLPAEVDLHLGGLFLQDELDLVPDRVRLFTGMRFEHNSYSEWEFQPSARIAWAAHPQHTLWAAVSRATRTPSRIDGDIVVPPEEPFTLVGNPDVDSEAVVAYELGWRGHPAPELATSFTLYYHDYNRLRSVEPGPHLRISNLLDGRSYGAEFFVDWQVRDGWRLRLGGFALDQATTLRPGGADVEAGLGEASNPSYQWQVRSAFDLREDLLLWLSVRTVGKVPVYNLGTDAGAVPAYTELDANLRWTIRPGLEWSISGRNLLHDSHPELGSNAVARREVERSLYTTLRWEF